MYVGKDTVFTIMLILFYNFFFIFYTHCQVNYITLYGFKMGTFMKCSALFYKLKKQYVQLPQELFNYLNIIFSSN